MPRESYISDVKEHLQSLGIWEKLTGGKLNCFVCKRQVSLDNFGMVFYDDDSYNITCNGLSCIRAITMGQE